MSLATSRPNGLAELAQRQIIPSLEDAAHLTLAAHGIMTGRGDSDMARVLWVSHCGVVRAAEAMGELLGIESGLLD